MPVIKIYGESSDQKESSRVEPFRDVLIIAEQPGPAQLFAITINEFHKRGISTYALLSGLAEEIIIEKFKTSTKNYPLNNNYSIILVANSEPKFGIPQTLLAIENNPRAKIVVVEDSPGSTKVMIEALRERRYKPNLWLVPTRSQSSLYKREFPQLATETPIIPIGLPSLDSLITKYNLDERSLNKLIRLTKEELKIPDDSLMITYAGIPSIDAPHAVDSSVDFPDLNSVTLREILATLHDIARENPQKHFSFIYKPHPRESEELWEHPYLNKSSIPSNLQIISNSRAEWKRLAEMGIDLKAISIASHVQLSSCSTVNHETAVIRSLSPRLIKTIPLYFWLGDSVDNTGVVDKFQVKSLITSFTPAVFNQKGLKSKIVKLLQDKSNLFLKDSVGLTNIIRQVMAGKTQKETGAYFEYMLDSPATERIYSYVSDLFKVGQKDLA